MADSQDRAEALDEDKMRIDPAVDDDPGHDPDYPPNRPVGVDDYGVTAAEEWIEEPIEERADREEPDPLVEALDEAGGPEV